MLNEFHYIQRNILNTLLFNDRLKYSQIKPKDMEGSQFTFHLNKVIKSGLVVKTGSFYSLTPKGKNIANTFDTDSSNPQRQAKHSVVFCAFKKIGDKQHTLLYTRKKNPFFNHQGYPTGKVMYGENILETAERELFEEAGLKGTAKLIGIRHYRVYFPTKNNLAEDKVMYICRIDEPQGEIKSNEEGDFYWVSMSEIESRVTRPLPEFKEIYGMVKNFDGSITFSEQKHFPEDF